MMYTETDKKIDNLPSRDKYRFYLELDNIFNDRYHSAQFGIMGRDYDSLPIEKIEEAKEKLYKKMFENDEEVKKDN